MFSDTKNRTGMGRSDRVVSSIVEFPTFYGGHVKFSIDLVGRVVMAEFLATHIILETLV
jgi:hypothetical protein